jgi:CheY-like chemotaxis protein
MVAKILVIDDEFGIGELLRDLFTDEGHDVVLAVSGRQGLDLIAKERPDLIFLDFMMPVLDGPGVMKAMKLSPDMAAIPVIVMSSLPEAVVKARISGHVAYVRKPFQIDHMVELAAKVLAGKGQGPTGGNGG